MEAGGLADYAAVTPKRAVIDGVCPSGDPSVSYPNGGARATGAIFAGYFSSSATIGYSNAPKLVKTSLLDALHLDVDYFWKL